MMLTPVQRHVAILTRRSMACCELPTQPVLRLHAERKEQRIDDRVVSRGKQKPDDRAGHYNGHQGRYEEGAAEHCAGRISRRVQQNREKNGDGNEDGNRENRVAKAVPDCRVHDRILETLVIQESDEMGLPGNDFLEAHDDRAHERVEVECQEGDDEREHEQVR